MECVDGGRVDCVDIAERRLPCLCVGDAGWLRGKRARVGIGVLVCAGGVLGTVCGAGGETGDNVDSGNGGPCPFICPLP